MSGAFIGGSGTYELVHQQEINAAIQLADAASRTLSRDPESNLARAFLAKAEELISSTMPREGQKP